MIFPHNRVPRPANIPTLILASLLVVIAQAANAGDTDPCDFATDAGNGQVLFDHDRVMACFNSVPLRAEDQVQMADLLGKARSRSSIRGVYQEYYDWQGGLEDLETGEFVSDYELQHAIVMDHIRHENGHYSYLPPRCYNSILAAILPLNLGSMIHNGSQIIYVDGITGAPQEVLAAYETELGVPLSSLVGMKVDTINGMEPLAYFRDQANTVVSPDTNDGTVLNGILTDQRYHLRGMSSGFPAQSEDVMQLSSRSGNRSLSLSLPWKFVELARLGAINTLPLPVGTTDFIETCYEPNPLLANLNGQLTEEELKALGYRDAEEEVRREAELRDRLEKNKRFSDVPASTGGFYEVPPGQRGEKTVEIGRGPSFVAYQYKKKATIIKTFNFASDWTQQMLEFTEYACNNSDSLVLDFTENGGGSVWLMEWLASHLDPRPAGEIPRMFVRGVVPAIDYEQDLLVTLPLILDLVLGIPQDECPPGWFGVQAGCRSDAETGETFTDISWMSDVHVEYRGGFEEWVTRPHYILANLGPYEHPAPPISCPGKFGKDNLIMLVDGTNASAGYFLPAMMDDISTSLAIGGFHGEAITLGSARGGNVLSVNGTSATLLQGLSQGVPFSSEVLLFSRNVDSRYEQYGSYREDLETLHVVDPVTPDLRLPVWGSTTANATRSYIYAEVVKAIK